MPPFRATTSRQVFRQTASDACCYILLHPGLSWTPGLLECAPGRLPSPYTCLIAGFPKEKNTDNAARRAYVGTEDLLGQKKLRPRHPSSWLSRMWHLCAARLAPAGSVGRWSHGIVSADPHRHLHLTPQSSPQGGMRAGRREAKETSLQK